jgi:hypothetical protein
MKNGMLDFYTTTHNDSIYYYYTYFQTKSGFSELSVRDLEGYENHLAVLQILPPHGSSGWDFTCNSNPSSPAPLAIEYVTGCSTQA